jgi:hypothetical protein
MFASRAKTKPNFKNLKMQNTLEIDAEFLGSKKFGICCIPKLGTGGSKMK